MKTILFMALPAWGHCYPMLPVIRQLSQAGYEVTCYNTAGFQTQIEESGALFREYPPHPPFPMNQSDRLLPLYDYLLTVSKQVMDTIPAERYSLVIHDTLALWGKLYAKKIGAKAICFNPLITVNHPLNASFWKYCGNFSLQMMLDLPLLNSIRRHKKELGQPHLNLLTGLTNREAFNITSFDIRFQPGGRGFKNHYFMGPAVLGNHREQEENIFVFKEKKPLVYVSLGTVFNDSGSFYQDLFSMAAHDQTHNYWVVILNPKLRRSCRNLPKHIHLSGFVNQKDLLHHAWCFIGCGGMNSLQESIYCRVPSILVPMQGEQNINCKQAQKLGLGIIKGRKTWEQCFKAIEKMQYPEKLADELTNVNRKDLLAQISDYLEQ